jgi:hypothetical protein
VRENPGLQALPRYAFTPPRPSEYRIRREPEAAYVSTIEALVHVLGALEGDAARFEVLLRPFHAMIEAQIACERARHGGATRHLQWRSRPRLPRVPPLLAAPGVDVVCVAGEANAWPYRERENGVTYEDELVHWAGRRWSTGEVFDRVVAPVRPLAPRTAAYVELDPERIASGVTPSALFDDWRRFVRESDVVCFWGHYAASLFAQSGGYLPPGRLDLRAACRDHVKAKVGSLDEFLARLGLAASTPPLAGRAGRRLAQQEAIVAHFLALAS